MIRALSAEQVRTAEAAAVASGTAAGELMRRAGAAVSDEVARRSPAGRVVVVAGKGNNGGDGWVAARLLAAAGRDVAVIPLAPPAELAEPAASAAREAMDAGVPVLDPEPATVRAECEHAACVVDAVFGIGVRGAPAGPSAACIDAMSGARFTIAVDIPSGVDADTGAVPGIAVRADLTVTFTAPKRGLVLYPGAGLAGELVVADIGMPAQDAEGPELWEPGEYAALLPVLRPDIHKNERGRVLVVAGSRAYPGAAALAVAGAQRMGAGYVTLAVPESIVPVMQAKLTSAVVVGFPESNTKSFASRAAGSVLEWSHDHDAVLVGPGLTVASGAVLLVRQLVPSLERPLVLDADALNALVDAVDLLRARSAPTIVTPHPGELARLLGSTPGAVQADRLSYGSTLATGRTACVLKGARTIVSGGGRQVVTLSGSPALAAAGTGDVLAGMAVTLLAQGLPPFEAGALAAYLHGRAGEGAADRSAERCVIAEDIPSALPAAVAALERASATEARPTEDEQR